MLDVHCLSDGHEIHLPNTDNGHSELERIASDREALVCFEATGGHEWRLREPIQKGGCRWS